MHARLSRFAGLDPERLEQTVEEFQHGALPELREREGFRGITVAINRRSGQAFAMTLWDSEADMRASEKLATEARERAIASARPSREPIVDHYEVVVQSE
jgi:heme-degrading monooxygenase HmoA